MPDTNDPLRSLFQEAASAGQPGTALPPVSEITRRGERARRRRIAGLAVATCLVLAGSGAALAGLLPEGRGGNLPATTPSAPAPSSLSTPGATSTPPPQPSPTSPGPPPPTTAGPSSTRTSTSRSALPPPTRTTAPVLPSGTPPNSQPTSAPSNHVTR